MSPLSILSEFTAGVLRISVQGTAVIGLVLLAQWLFRTRLSPRWRYALWMIVLIRLALPVSLPSPFSIFNYAPAVMMLARSLPERGAGAVDSFLPVEIQAPAETPSALASKPGQRPSDHSDGTGAPTASAVSPPVQAREPGISKTVIGESAVENAPRSMLLGFFSLIWLGGALFLVLRILTFPWRLNVELARHERPAEPELFDVLDQSKRQMRVRRVLPIVQSRAVKSPALLGFIRPWLLLPEGMAKLFSRDELRLVFLHELAHLKRRDIAVNWLMTLVQVLHWFNPFVWLAFSRMRADRELACDELALSHAPESDRKAYGQTMIKLLESFARPTAIAGLVGILEDKQQMKRRIDMIAQFRNTPDWPFLAPVIAVALGSVSLTDAQTENTEKQLAISRPAMELTMRRLPELPYDIVLADHISQDGRYIVGYTRNTLGNPTLFELATSAKRRLDIKATSFRISPDNRQIAVGLRDLDHFPRSLVVMDLETEKARTLYRFENRDKTLHVSGWSPDGQNILTEFFTGDGAAQIALISAMGGAVRVLKTFEPKQYPSRSTFSPDGRWIAYNSIKGLLDTGTGDIHLLASNGSRDISVVQHPANDQLLGWFPDGKRLLFASDRRGSWCAYAIEVADGKPVGEPVMLTESLGKVRQPLGFTPEAAFFFVSETRGSDVYITELDPASGRVQKRPRKAAQIEGRNQHPAWSRDGRFLAYISCDGSVLRGGSIHIHDIEAGAVRELSSDAGNVTFPQWSPDGQSLLAIGSRDSAVSAFSIDSQSGKSTVLTSGVGRLLYNTWCTWWSWDGKSLYHQTAGTTVERHDLETGTKIEIAVLKNLYTTVISPDGQLFALSVTRKHATNDTEESIRTIYIMPASGGEPRPVVELTRSSAIDELQTSPDRGLGWTPDSRHVLFVKGMADNPRLRSLWRVPVDGGEAEPLGVEMEELREPVISPDGRHLAFTAGGMRKDIWVMENFLPQAKRASR